MSNDRTVIELEKKRKEMSSKNPLKVPKSLKTKASTKVPKSLKTTPADSTD